MGKEMSLKEFKELLPMLKDDVIVSIDINSKRGPNVNRLVDKVNEYMSLLVDMYVNYLLPSETEIKIGDVIDILRSKIEKLEESSLKPEDIFPTTLIENLKELSLELYTLTRCNKITNLIDELTRLLNIKVNNTSLGLENLKENVEKYYKECIVSMENIDGLNDMKDILEKLHGRYIDGKYNNDINCPDLITMASSLYFDTMELMFSKTDVNREMKLKLFEAFDNYVISLDNVIKMVDHD